MTEWQDISTAPRDGTPILAVDNIEGVSIARFNGLEWEFYMCCGTVYEIAHSHWSEDVSPTRLDYWMPLPKPPNE